VFPPTAEVSRCVIELSTNHNLQDLAEAMDVRCLRRLSDGDADGCGLEFLCLASTLPNSAATCRRCSRIRPIADNHRAAARATSSRSWSKHFFECGKGQAVVPVRGTLWAAYTEATSSDRPSSNSP
jgi:hypothetical protein